MIDVTKEICQLVKEFETTQYNFEPNLEFPKRFPILTRNELRNLEMKPLFYTTKTSGSTGEPVTVEKTVHDYIWYQATNIREMQWRGWKFQNNLAVVKPTIKATQDKDHWGVPKQIAPNQGKCFTFPYDTIENIQNWLEEKNPHYLHCAPTIVKQLDLSRISNLIDVKGTGELGGSMYSTEECGTIAIQCPHNKESYHVMENQIVETTEDGEILITTLTNPYIRRYKHGDVVVLGKCSCGRSLQTITTIHGRVRNLFVMPNGQKKWPLFGSRTYHEKYNIKQYKAIQKEINKLELQVIAEKLSEDKEKELKLEIQELLQISIDVEVVYKDCFSNYKHEEFVCLI